MAELTDKKLLTLITYAPAAIVAVFALLWTALSVRDVMLHSEQELISLRADFQQRQSTQLTSQVEYVAQQVDYARELTEEQLENTIRERIYEAHKIATRIYESNRHLPEATVTKMITDALRDIRFNQGRGYFFIYKIDGMSIMHPLLPKVEGTSLWDFRDVRGSYIVREMGEQVKANDEAFYRWWFVKPDNKNHEFEKIGFGKYFAPYDWFIGTGDYVVDVENDIKDTVLKWINNLRFGDYGYVFVMDEKGTVLSHIDPNLIGRNALQGESEASPSDAARLAKADHQFVTYQAAYLPSGLDDQTKTSYVIKIPAWGWTIGSGVYEQVSQNYLKQRELQAKSEGQSTFRQMATLGSATIAIVALFSLGLSRVIAKRFQRFQRRINQDFKQLKQTKDQLEYIARHDELTGLPNRSLLHERIREGIEKSEQQCCQLAVMFVDLDDFKKVNDLYGHSAGDRLLSEIGKKFEAFLEPGDFVARFGGDEFIFCFPCLDNLAQTQQKVEKIKQVFRQQFVIDNKVLFTSCSIGVAMYPSDGHAPEELISKADIVLYKSKARQKGDVLFFDSSINLQVQHDFLLERELRGAIERGELYVVYQPQVATDSGKLHGVESLLRWHNPQLGHVSPIEFISLAEEIGLINQLGQFVIHRACEEMSQLFPDGDSDLTLSINISPMQLISDAFITQLTAAAARYQIANHRITLEITENVLINDMPKVKPIIEQLKELGFTISLDDFGTGYSSLSYLSHLTLDEIKVDRLFIDKMLNSEQSDSLVKAIIAIARSSDMRVVAEGVETEAQRQKLKEYGCDILQGYLIERPISAQLLAEKYATPAK